MDYKTLREEDLDRKKDLLLNSTKNNLIARISELQHQMDNLSRRKTAIRQSNFDCEFVRKKIKEFDASQAVCTKEYESLQQQLDIYNQHLHPEHEKYINRLYEQVELEEYNKQQARVNKKTTTKQSIEEKQSVNKIQKQKNIDVMNDKKKNKKKVFRSKNKRYENGPSRKK